MNGRKSNTVRATQTPRKGEMDKELSSHNKGKDLEPMTVIEK